MARSFSDSLSSLIAISFYQGGVVRQWSISRAIDDYYSIQHRMTGAAWRGFVAVRLDRRVGCR